MPRVVASPHSVNPTPSHGPSSRGVKFWLVWALLGFSGAGLALASPSIPEEPEPQGAIAPACQPDYPLRDAVAALQPGESLDCERHDLACHEGHMTRVQGLIAEHPDDLGLRLIYQNLHEHWPGPERPRMEKLRLETARALAASPDDPKVRFLYARSLPPAENWEPLLQAAASMPSSPWPHLDLALASNYSFEVQDPARSDEHLERFYQRCPVPPAWTMVYGHVGFGSNEFWRRHVPALRRGVEAMPPYEKLLAFYHLWGLESRVLGVDGREGFHQQIRDDLASFEGAGFEDRIDYWVRRAQGARRIGDDALAREAWQQLARRFPCHTMGRVGQNVLWDQDHDNELETIHRAFMREEPVPTASPELRRAIAAISKRCPKDYPNAKILFALTVSDESAAEAEVLAAADRWIQLYDELWHLDELTVEPYRQVALALLDREMAPRRAFDLLEREAEHVAQGRRNALDEVFVETMAEQRSRRRALDDFDLDVDRLRAAIATGDLELAKTTAEQAGRSMVLAEEQVDEGQPLRRWRQHAGDYFAWRGELAELEKTPLDAVAFWLRAETIRAAGTEGETIPDEPRSLAVWRRQGGSEEGWRALAESVAVTLEPMALDDAWAWEELDRPLEDFTLQAVDGRVWRRADLAGRVVLVNFWATWCGPCVEELSLVQDLHERFDGRDDVLVLTFNVDRDLGRLRPFLERGGYTFPTVLANDYFNRVLPVDELLLPQTWLIDPQGVLRARQRGFVASEEHSLEQEIIARLDALASQKKP